MILIQTLKKKKLTFASKLNQALDDNDSGSKRLRKIHLLALLGFAVVGTVVILSDESRRSMLISLSSKVISKCKSIRSFQEDVDLNNGLETTDKLNKNWAKTINKGLVSIVIVISLILLKKCIDREECFEIEEIPPISWWSISYPWRLIGGTIMIITSVPVLTTPFAWGGPVLIFTGWQLATQGVPSS